MWSKIKLADVITLYRTIYCANYVIVTQIITFLWRRENAGSHVAGAQFWSMFHFVGAFQPRVRFVNIKDINFKPKGLLTRWLEFSKAVCESIVAQGKVCLFSLQNVPTVEKILKRHPISDSQTALGLPMSLLSRHISFIKIPREMNKRTHWSKNGVSQIKKLSSNHRRWSTTFPPHSEIAHYVTQ
jgi:hypothetical protein